jgi:hypothetical protein
MSLQIGTWLVIRRKTKKQAAKDWVDYRLGRDYGGIRPVL